MKKDREKESVGERQRSRDAPEIERQKVCYVQADAPAVGNPTPISYRDCCWVYLSVGRSIGRPVGRGRTERKRENEVYTRVGDGQDCCSLEYLCILRNISDTQIIINIISSSSCSPVIGATILRVRNTFTTWMIPYSPCDTCVGFQFSLIIQGDLPNPYFFHSLI